MKILLPVILLAALAAGLWQRSEIAALAERENSLRSKLAPVSSSGAVSGLAQGPDAATKTGSRARAKPFDAAAFVDTFLGWVARDEAGGGPPSDEELTRLFEEMAAASPKELAGLVDELRRKNVREDLRKGFLIPIAPRLAESDPELAAELAVEGGEGKGFHSVMRTWLSRDPKAAAKWLTEAAAANPPLDKSRFRHLDDLDLEALSLTARLTADPAGEGLEELLHLESKPQGKALMEIAASMPPAEMAAVMKRISQYPGLSEDERLCIIGGTLARHQDPVMARQILVDAALPPEQFREAATTMIVSLDPTGIRSGIEWFRTSTSGETKTEGIRGIVAAWAQQDPKAATEWAEGLSDPAERADVLSVIPGKHQR